MPTRLTRFKRHVQKPLISLLIQRYSKQKLCLMEGLQVTQRNADSEEIEGASSFLEKSRQSPLMSLSETSVRIGNANASQEQLLMRSGLPIFYVILLISI